jgi:GTP-binding protein
MIGWIVLLLVLWGTVKNSPFFQTIFKASFTRMDQLTAWNKGGREIAFAGRSNAGKSSVLNALCNRKSLAKTSSTPGKTREFVYFSVQEQFHLVDLPGYGFARVPPKEQEAWGREMTRYILERENLVAIVIIMDARHSLGDKDREMLKLVVSRPDLKIHIVLNKEDKLNRAEKTKAMASFEKKLHEMAPDREITFQMASADKRSGMEDLRTLLESWL